ncbi:MAG: FliH/SctL family protein [Alphaproteobacteria bacterium]|nr:FliH/SctL family protein [Alphaproteobacteria bacterium]
MTDTVTKFMFERSFDDMLPAPSRAMAAAASATAALKPADDDRQVLADALANLKAEPQPVKEILYTKAQMDQGIASSFNDGKAAGKLEAENTMAAQVLETVNKIGVDIALTKVAVETAREEAVKAAHELAFAIVKKTMPAMAASYGAPEILAVVEKYSAMLVNKSNCQISVNPALRYDVEEGLSAFVRDKTVEVVGDAEVVPGDCRIQWDGGGIYRKASDIIDEIEKVLKG